MYQFEKLDIWKDSLRIVKAVYALTENFPNEEKFALNDQLKRAVVSIALNIAEGRGSGNDIEFRRFLRIAISSLFETVASIKVAIELGYLKESEAEEALGLLEVEGSKIKALIKSLGKEA